MAIESLNSETGVHDLLAKLDTLYLKDEKLRTYNAYDTFEQLKRGSHMSINDYLIDFEKKLAKIQEYGITLPDPVLAYRLLKSANISKEKEVLVKATVADLTYAAMKNKLKGMFDGFTVDGRGMKIKEEEDDDTYYNMDDTFYGRNTDSKKGQRVRFKIEGNSSRKHTNHQQSSSTKKLNPRNKDGFVSRCAICKSIYHWAEKCPEREDSVPSLYTADMTDKGYIHTFLGETLNMAVLDSGCIHTVCGEAWLNCYLESLNNVERDAVITTFSSRGFKFGDGKEYVSM